LLVNDIRRCRKELTQEYEWFSSLDSVRQDAIIDLSFNLGQTKLRTFVKALGHMATGNYEEAGQEFYRSRWAEQVGDRSLEICQMISSGEYQVR
jgi:GH24 family phage-related lysozyme (muramidase)